ncbi:DUF2510 domain-containing protein [Mycobacterium sp. 94-17]|uniref:DUF2510 domain-containing protein n=1 Tax=Mycobacterium sp. 94-17 TaxID=2986147 RepID=UPI002D1F1895|nr:DUF2510 domain-containing protein [Mycobacterium sp. 94-17]MEB4212337.1 DUF2510 domain-containing protein [Mycobacterium sp. 94-17]
MAQPGWYPNPNGDKRSEAYWDGKRWTTTRPFSQQQTVQPGAAAAGWYPSSQVPGSWQYWDGQRWTGHPAPASPPPQGINLKPLLFAILAVLAVIAVVLLSTKPWESEGYKHCVAEQKAQAGGSSNVNSQLKSGIEDYCHRNYD